MKRNLFLACTFGIFMSPTVQAKQNVCVFDLLGKAGESYKVMEEWALAAKAWEADINLIPYKTEEQAEVYAGVLKVQKQIIEFIKPGVVFQELHEMGTSLLTDLMLNLGLLTGRKDDIIKAAEQKKYYPHGIGHFLGLDVHDAGMYFTRNPKEPRPIVEGMVFTVEPGIYIPLNDESVATSE